MLDEARQREFGEGEFIEFFRAGTDAVGEFRCSGCGYGVTVQSALPLCPMCSGTMWEAAAWSPFTRESPLQ